MKLNNQESSSLFLKCSCHTHVLEIQKHCDDIDGGFYISIWELNRNSNIMNWKERFRWIWNIFRTGNPWSDSIILSNEQAKQITNYINKHL